MPVRQMKLTRVGFRAHVKITSRIVSYCICNHSFVLRQPEQGLVDQLRLHQLRSFLATPFPNFLLAQNFSLYHLVELFKTMKRLSSTPWSHFFNKAEGISTRGHTWKLAKKHCHCDSRLYFFSQRVINRWNNLSQENVHAQYVNCFKNRLEKRRTRQMDFFKDLQSTSPIGCKKGQSRTCASRWNVYARCSRTR